MLTANKAQLTCKQCNQILEDPVYFPCFCTVCHVHLRDATDKNKGMIKCVTCDKEFDINHIEVKINAHAKILLQADEHLHEKEKVLKNDMHTLIDQFEEIRTQFNERLKRAELLNHEKFAEIRRQIDLHREEYKEKIDKTALEKIAQANADEKKHREHLKRLQSFSGLLNLDEERNSVNELFRHLNLSRDSLQALKTKHQLQLQDMRAKMSDLEQINSQINGCEFRASTFSDIGTLYLKTEYLLSCSDDRTVKIWDLETNECVHTLTEHAYNVSRLKIVQAIDN